jgi:hypothetical protein
MLLQTPKPSTTMIPNGVLLTYPKQSSTACVIFDCLHFDPTQCTPFTVPPLSKLIDWEASTKTSDLILEGNYSNTDLTDQENLLIRHYQHFTDCNSISTKIMEAQFKSRFKGWHKSTTTTPPLGINLGHYKALLISNPSLNPNFVEADIFDKDRVALIRAPVQQINFTIHHYFFIFNY